MCRARAKGRVPMIAGVRCLKGFPGREVGRVRQRGGGLFTAFTRSEEESLQDAWSEEIENSPYGG